MSHRSKSHSSTATMTSPAPRNGSPQGTSTTAPTHLHIPPEKMTVTQVLAALMTLCTEFDHVGGFFVEKGRNNDHRKEVRDQFAALRTACNPRTPDPHAAFRALKRIKEETGADNASFSGKNPAGVYNQIRLLKQRLMALGHQNPPVVLAPTAAPVAVSNGAANSGNDLVLTDGATDMTAGTQTVGAG